MYNSNINNKLYEYYLSRWSMVDGHNGWMIGTCPDCGKDRKWGVNIDKGKTNCFICGRGTSPLRRIIELENLNTLPEALTFLKAYEGIEYIIKEEKVELSPINFPESYHLITQGTSQYAEMFRNYLRGRGFNINYLRSKGVGYCLSGKHAGRVILPYYRNGKLVYFNARDIMNTGMKFLNPEESTLGYGKTQVIYNWDALQIYSKIYLCESVTNALTMGDRGIGIGGKAISHWQLSEIVRSPVKDIVILLDDDALEEAYRLALSLCEYKNVKVVHMPTKLDVNKLGKPETLKLIKKTPYLKMRELRKIYLDLKST